MNLKISRLFFHYEYEHIKDKKCLASKNHEGWRNNRVHLAGWIYFYQTEQRHESDRLIREH